MIVEVQESKLIEVNLSNGLLRFDLSFDNVFSPHPISNLMAANIKVSPTDSVLDLCTGSGIIAISIAKYSAAKVTASDISDDALFATKTNSKLNKVADRITFIKSDYFKSFRKKKFDVIMSNPPCMPVPKNGVYTNSGLTLAVDGGVDGTEGSIKFISEARNYLTTNGSVYFPLPMWCDWRKVMEVIEKYYDYQVVATERVRYYLADYDESFRKHIFKMEADGLVEFYNKKELTFNVELLRLQRK